MAVETKNDQYISYPMFKGLQKPLLQAEEGTAHQEGRPWSVHLCLLNEDVNPNIQISTNEQVCHNLNHV